MRDQRHDSALRFDMPHPLEARMARFVAASRIPAASYGSKNPANCFGCHTPPSGGGRRHPRRGNTLKGQRGSRCMVGIEWTGAGKSSPRTRYVPGDVEPAGKPELRGVHVGRHLSFDGFGKAYWGQAMVANPAPGGRKPTVRDETGGLGKRGLWRNCEPTSQSKGRGW